MALALTAAVAGSVAADSGATLSVSPASAAATQGQTFDLQVVQDSPVATSGAQASIQFDPSILQIVSISPGQPYAKAPIFEPPTLPSDILHANITGRLSQVAIAFTPPGNVPAGRAAFLIIRFRVVGCGQTDVQLPTLGPFNAQMISGETNGYGSDVPVTTTGGHVTTCVTANVPAAAGGAGTFGTTTTAASNGGSAVGTSLPIALIGAAAILAVAGLGLLVWRSRRQEPGSLVR
jgi:hypothetical protein